MCQTDSAELQSPEFPLLYVSIQGGESPKDLWGRIREGKGAAVWWCGCTFSCYPSNASLGAAVKGFAEKPEVDFELMKWNNAFHGPDLIK